MSRLLGLLNDQSVGGAARRADEIKRLPLDSIIPNEANFYGMRQIEELAADIEEHGLLHNLVVRETEDYGVYKLIDGERRYRALNLIGAGHANCLILDVQTDAEAEYALIQANATQRDQTDAERATAAVRLVECMKQLRKEGHEFKGRTREIVAKALDVSPAQVGRYEKIEHDLAPALKEEFKAGTIGVTEAYELATQIPEQQAEAARRIKETGKAKEKPARHSADERLQEFMEMICDDYCKYASTCTVEELKDRCASCMVELNAKRLLKG